MKSHKLPSELERLDCIASKSRPTKQDVKELALKVDEEMAEHFEKMRASIL